MAAILDQLNIIRWMQTKDGRDGRNRPKQVLSMLIGEGEEKEKDVVAFASGEDFEKARRRVLEGINGITGNGIRPDSPDSERD